MGSFHFLGGYDWCIHLMIPFLRIIEFHLKDRDLEGFGKTLYVYCRRLIICILNLILVA